MNLIKDPYSKPQSLLSFLSVFCFLFFSSANLNAEKNRFHTNSISEKASLELRSGKNLLNAIACNTGIQVSTDENCEALISPDMILEGTYTDFNDYEISMATIAGTDVRNPINSSFIGAEVIVTITEISTGNSCWGKIKVEDKLGPEFTCRTELLDKSGNVVQSGDTIRIICDIDPATIPEPEAIDHCSNAFVSLINEVVSGDNCNILTINRTYRAEDQYGNSSANNCTITIEITQPEIEFPDDITWTCEQFRIFPNIATPTALHPLIIANAASMDEDDVPGIAPYQANPLLGWWTDGEDLDVTLNPNWDDNQDNCQSRNERDTDECLANFAGTFVQCVDNSSHDPVITNSPLHTASLLRGLEDADLLELSGSGVPNVFGLNKHGCKFSTTYRDQKLTACNGVDTITTFKILRTWTVLNWCTNEVSTDIQIIKVIDKVAPEITFPDDFVTEFSANEYTSTGNHSECGSSRIIGLPEIIDNCSGVDSSRIRLYTTAGEGVPQFDAANILIGFAIPAPYLPVGNHSVTYEAVDFCGNKSIESISIRVTDGIPPVAICREFTQIALSGSPDGITEIQADKFNEASYDNCSSVYFKVRRMERFDCDRANVDTPNEIRSGTTTADDRELFDDKVKFCCMDIGDTVAVILRVYDTAPDFGSVSDTYLAARSNDCMIRVFTEDKIRPLCHAPADVWTTCVEVPDNLDLFDRDELDNIFGEATATDNCNATLIENSPVLDLDLCGVGTVTRDWTARDSSGNRSIGNCRQTIMILPETSYKIFIPGDFEEECAAAAPADLTYEENACDLLAVNLEENNFAVSPLGECLGIIRTWRVINWCEYDGFSAPIRLQRRDLNGDSIPGDGTNGSSNAASGNNFNAEHTYISDGSRMILNGGPEFINSVGYYEYKQHVKIFDNTAPEAEYSGDTVFCGGELDEDPCTGQVDISINAFDLCTNNVTVIWQLDYFSDSFVSSDQQGTGSLSGRYPLGTHTIKHTIEDECGNVSELDITFEVIDCKAPTPVCFNGLSVDLTQGGFASIPAEDFDASSFDYCNPIVQTINVVTDRNDDGVINANDYLRIPPIERELLLDCSNLGQALVQLWVGEISNEFINNWDYCVTFIDVQDNFGSCSNSKITLGGKVTNENGEPVENVMIDLNNGMRTVTGIDGKFDFSINRNSDITLTPMRDDDPANGVSTFDLLQISKHILNIERLDSPYKIIAADADNSGSISTIDLLAIRKVILKAENEFPNNRSWRFIDSNHIFQNPNNPFAENFSEVVNRNNLSTDELNANFTAVKIGDVTGDAIPNSVLNIDNRSRPENLILETEEKEVKAGESFEITFVPNREIVGFQFTLDFDKDAVELQNIGHQLTSEQNFNILKNKIAGSWNGNNAKKNTELFSLRFLAKADTKTSEFLTINSSLTEAEAYTKDELLNIALKFKSSEGLSDFELFQNLPNPFKTETVIGFYLPKASEATLTVSDISGKILRIVEGNFTEGTNQIILEKTSDLPAGILFYELKTETHRATRKMSLIK